MITALNGKKAIGMTYKDYKILDFLMDEDFQQWVFCSTEASDDHWNRVILENPGKREIIDQAKKVLRSIDYEKTGISESDKKHILISIQRRINTARSKEAASTPQKYGITKAGNEDHLSVTHKLSQKKDKSGFWRGIAAGLIGIAIVTAALYFPGHPSKNVETIAIDYWERSSLKGEKRSITLSDGTKIKLNSNSKLIVPQQFPAHERKVSLVGEAYFEVSEDASRPFIITSREINVAVLGTSFNVRAYPSENTVQVAVATGTVSVEKTADKSPIDQEPILLSPNEMVTYFKATGNANKESFDPMAVFAWKDDILYFKDADIYTVIERLEQWYGVTFIVKTQLNEDKDLNGSFRDKSLSAILDGLSYVFGFDYQIEGKIVTLN